MKTYNLKIICPGISLQEVKVKADYYEINEGAYEFYLGGRNAGILCCYPVNFTIIESIN
jgi:methionine aminopeptidase